jgi:two-component system sensor histidine kinase ChvG
LVRAEFDALSIQTGLMAEALGEAATALTFSEQARLVESVARPMVRRFALQTRARAQLFDADGELLADSQLIMNPQGFVTVLPLPGERDSFHNLLERAYDWVFNAFAGRDHFPAYPTLPLKRAQDYREGARALAGERGAAAYRTPDGLLVFTIALPVQRYRQVVGVVMLSRASAEIDDAMRKVRVDILTLFSLVLGLTMLVSVYLAGTIARPVRKLAVAAERVRTGHGKVSIPDFSYRRDEIGDLSVALGAMTTALWQRLEAIERFAADVSHEIKNPLSSLRSAVETVSKLEDPEKRARLMRIIQEDVRRLDRLITDIAAASRVDAELARAELEPLDIGRLLAALAEVYQAAGEDDEDGDGSTPKIRLDIAHGEPLTILGVEDRLVQVFRNLIGNAQSFSPPGGTITLAARRDGERIIATCDDEGPGIPDGKAETIFQRFYSERPGGEAFGRHSGLGLSISRQIIDGHGGSLRAENRHSADGKTLGARFTVSLPVARSTPGKRRTRSAPP